MSSTAFIEPKTVMEFIRDLLNKELTRSLTDADRMKVCLLVFSVSVTLNCSSYFTSDPIMCIKFCVFRIP